MPRWVPYTKYKDPGVEWLGIVPEHWEVKRLKHIADVRLSNVDKHTVEGQTVVRLCNYLDVYNNRLITSKVDFMTATASDEQITRLSVRMNDVIITKDSEDPSDIGIPALVAEDIFGLVCGYHLAILRPTMSNGEFLHYFLQSIFVRSAFEVEATGMTRYALGKYSIENLIFALPHQSEQKSIASFLDRETSRINSLLSEKEHLIALLKEYRQALISHIVTKGLDPNVKMKDSGVEWLGEVPEHWRVTTLKHIVSIPITDGPHETPNFHDKGIPFVSAEAVASGQIDFEKIRGYISEEDHARYSLKYHPKIHDIYMVKSGATTGVTAIVETDVEFSIWSPLAAIRCGDLVAPYFVLNFLRSTNFQEALALNWSFGTQQNIGMGVLQNISISIPPAEEQEYISSFLDQETSRIDTLISEAKKFIDLLKEGRSSLITAAVTGKINVLDEVESS
ncbi:MAG: restriction endonuclease subunit S [Leptospirales bacterium]